MKILLIKTNILGDAVMATPFIEALDNSRDFTQIDVLCNEYNEIAFRYNPYISQIYPVHFKDDNYNNSKKLAIGYSSVISKINHNMPDGYDAIICLNDGIKNLQYASLIKAKIRISPNFVTKSFSNHLWMFINSYSTHKLTYVTTKKEQHYTLRLYDLLINSCHLLGINSKTINFPAQCKFYLPPTTVKQIIKNSCVINISGRQGSLRYINDNMLYALLQNIEKYGITQVIVVATTKDKERANQVLNQTNVNSEIKIQLLVESNLITLAETINNYEYFIGCDGGLIHVAAGLGLYCIDIFDDEPSHRCHPWTPKQISLQASSKNIYDISYLDVLDSINKLREKS